MQVKSKHILGDRSFALNRKDTDNSPSKRDFIYRFSFFFHLFIYFILNKIEYWNKSTQSKTRGEQTD